MKRVAIGLSIIVIAMTAIPWFIIRPSNARKECHAFANDKVKDISRSNVKLYHYEVQYEACLHKKGL